MILDEICAHKRTEVADRKRATPIAEIHDRIAVARPPRDFNEAVRRPGMSLIAEVKKASPSKGPLLHGVDPVNLACLYEAEGARAISILTDERYFRGSLEDLVSVQQAVSLPCLRKEFIIDEFQVYEARAANADAILLIVRCLSDAQIKEYMAAAARLGMASLVETHDEKEIERAVNVGAHMIGINNRDLNTFEVDLNTTLRLKNHVPGGHALVSESGIRTRDHVRMLEDGGVDAILVGETLLTSSNIAQTIRDLLGLDEG